MRNDALSVVSKLAASSNNVFTRSQAAQVGLTNRSIASLKKSGLLAEPWRNSLVWMPPDRGPTWQQLIAAATIGREAWASHRSAARLLGMEGFDSMPDLDLSCSHAVNVRLNGVHVVRTDTLTSLDVTTVQGVKCTSIARTLCDLGSVVDPLLVERALDDALRNGVSPRWIRMTAMRASITRVRGRRVLLELLGEFEQRGVVRGSWFEKLVELCLAHEDLADLVLQYELRSTSGGHAATFDLAIPSAKLGIEAHSKRHHFGAAHEASDEHRDNRAGALGWDVMYLGYADIQSPSSVLERVLERVAVRRSQLAGTRSDSER